MVATISTLYGNVKNVAAYFTSLAIESYYGAERNGVWHGSLATSLGLVGAVATFALMNLLCGQSPNGRCLQDYWDKKNSKKVCPSSRHRENNSSLDHEKSRSFSVRSRAPGFDLTKSVPKSLSILFLVSSDDIRKKIEQILMDAARRTLTTLETNIPLTRRGYRGTKQEKASIASAMFLHLLNRNNDVQLHVHCIIPNICRTTDGQYRTINSRLLHNWTPTLGRIFRCELAHGLQKELGLKLYVPEREDGKKQSWFEIEGVPKKPIEHCSSRRKELLNHIQGDANTPGSASANARQKATLETRKAKDTHVDLETVLAEQKAEVKSLGFSTQNSEKLLHQTKPTPVANVYDKALQDALQEVTRQNAHFTAREIVQEVCEKTQHLGVSAAQIVPRVLKDLEQSKEIVRLREISGERRYTTLQMWQLEEALLKDVKQLQERTGAVVSEKDVAQTLAKHTTLSKEQREAAEKLLSDDKGIRVLSGVAGAGKSYTLNAVRDGLEQGGYRVIGGALAGAAKEELARQANIESRTVASYLYHLEKTTSEKLCDRVKHDLKMLGRVAQKRPTYPHSRVELDKKAVLIVDEAGMLPSKMLYQLTTQVVKSGGTLILAGDWKQLPPIEAGGPMHRIAREVSQDAKLTENRRQQNLADRQAVNDLRNGRINESLQSYAERERVTIGENRQETIEKLVDTWSQQGGARDPVKHMVFTHTRAEADYINQLCQAKRLEQPLWKPLLSAKLGEDRFYTGDRVLFHSPLRKYGVENGYRGTVVGVDPIRREIKVRLDQEPSAANKARGHSQTVKIPLRSLETRDMTLGYSATTHKMQGQTIENSYLFVCGEMTSFELTYVQATRAKETTQIFVDQAHAGEELKDLVKAVERSQAKNLAHDIAITENLFAGKDDGRSRSQSSDTIEPKAIPPQQSLNSDSPHLNQ